MGIDRDRRDFTHGTMGRSSFSIRPTKNRSDLSKNSTMDRILFFCHGWVRFFTGIALIRNA